MADAKTDDLEGKKKCDTPVVALACDSGSPKNKPNKNGPWFTVVPVKPDLH